MPIPKVVSTAGAIDEEAGYELLARFGATVSPLIEQFGEDSIDAIVMPVVRIIQEDRNAALDLLEKCPAVIESLLSLGEETLINVFQMANQVIPYGPRLAAKLLEMSPHILHHGDFETFTKTAALACRIAEVDVRAVDESGDGKRRHPRQRRL